MDRNRKEHGGDRKSEERQGTGSTLKVRGSTADYRTAKIARDAPDVVARFGAVLPPGEHFYG